MRAPNTLSSPHRDRLVTGFPQDRGNNNETENAMNQNHQSALKCVSLVTTSMQLLTEIKPATKEGLGKREKLGVLLEDLKIEHQRVIDRAERKQLRRVIREKMKHELAGHEGAVS